MSEFLAKYWQEGLFALIVALFTAAYRRLQKKVHKELCDQKSLKKGHQALLRSEIIRTYEKYMAQGWIPVYGRENIQAMYDAYHELGGNGAITQLKAELDELPSIDPNKIKKE